MRFSIPRGFLPDIRVTKIKFPGKIERVSALFFTLAQIVYILWPVFIVTALIYSFQGHWSLSALTSRIRQSLMITWVMLFIDWVITLFATLPTPGLIPEPWNTGAFFTGFILLLIVEASRLGFLKRRLRARVHIRRGRSLENLKEMDPYDFENLVGETYRSLGFEAKHVGRSGDHGVDVQLRAPNGELWIVQCKRYHGTVGESIVRDLYGTMISEKSNRAVLVTTAHITPPAHDWARGKPVELIDGPAFLKMMDEAHRRDEGTLLSRLATWLEGLLVPGGPAGLQPQKSTPISLDATQPVRLQSQGSARSTLEATQPVSLQRTTPVKVAATTIPATNHHHTPVCPNCGLPMVPRPPRSTDRPGRALYRCRNYPTCRVVVESQ
jgi:hypothetical protein